MALAALHGQRGPMEGRHGASKEGDDATTKESGDGAHAWREW